MAKETTRVRREQRLRMFNALPKRHQEHVYAEVRKMCAAYLAAVGGPAGHRDELVSEVFAQQLLDVAVLPSPDYGDQVKQKVEIQEEQLSQLPSGLVVDEHDPKRDGRVAWLIAEIGGRRALSHRYEDMRRRQFGGKWRPSGYYPMVQPSALSDVPKEPVDGEADQAASDLEQIWKGLLILAQAPKCFPANDDVLLLVKLLVEDANVRASYGPSWPISMIVKIMNERHPARPWNDDRVDNAKRRLVNWVERLRRIQGLDMVDLEALFVGVARERDVRIRLAPNPSVARDRKRR
jgi:hypothetical protein